MERPSQEPEISPTQAFGYLVPEFPSQTHAFFWREVQAIRNLGGKVVLFSTRRPPIDACPHEFARPARSETHYLFPPRIGASLAVILRHPIRSARCIIYAARLNESGFLSRARVAALTPTAAELASVAAREGVSHVHIHSCANAAHIGAMANILTGLNYSLTLHGDLPVYGTDHVAKFSRARVVTAVTRALKESILSISPDTQVQVVSMGVDTEKFAPPKRRRLGQTGPVRFLSISRLHPAKGHLHFLRCIAELLVEGLELKYRIAGSGPALTQILNEIEKLGLGETVEIVGSLSEEQVLKELHAADVFVLSSIGKGEAAPVAVMEAMATGLPVICSIIGGTPDMIEDDVDGFLVQQGNEIELAEAARRTICDPKLRQRIGKAARRRALQQFDFRVKARELIEAIER